MYKIIFWVEFETTHFGRLGLECVCGAARVDIRVMAVRGLWRQLWQLRTSSWPDKGIEKNDRLQTYFSSLCGYNKL